MSKERTCKNCTKFQSDNETIWGICEDLKGCISERCHKYNWCVDFKEKEGDFED